MDSQEYKTRTAILSKVLFWMSTVLADECREKHICPDDHTTCINMPGSYICVCKTGFSKNGSSCIDIDECSTAGQKCHQFASCINSIGSYQCECLSGFIGDGKNCSDIDECQSHNGGCHPYAMCNNTAGSFSCICPHGFTGNGTECWDIDECVLGNMINICNDSATCKNTEGSFQCECHIGFNGDGYNCVDLNECENTSICDENADCNNTLGSYLCSCRQGFLTADGLCLDINECHQQTICHPNANCINVQGSFYCSCKSGFSGNGTDCRDIDDCALNHSVCHEKAICNNTLGAYRCECWTGYEGNGTLCYDTNECLKNDTICSKYSICINTEGSYTCQCNEGFVGNGSYCEDINECNLINVSFQCHFDSYCMNTLGSFECHCEAGFENNGTDCIDIDECITNSSDCNIYASCINYLGGYDCDCFDGFIGNGTQCLDINECSADNMCHTNASCLNTQGSYQCLCDSGFTGDGQNCSDVDECFNNTICQEDQQCINAAGSFQCVCTSGFSENETFCVDIDECSINMFLCHSDANCINQLGSFLCVCQTGFVGDGFNCTDIDECSENGTECMDAEECTLGYSICHEKATCNNTIGAYYCKCRAGFEGNGTMCNDIDECIQNQTLCHMYSSCINTEGSYTCQCNEGFVGNGLYCEDINECILSNASVICHFDSYCMNTLGSFECHCEAGFESNGTECIDIDECITNSSDCNIYTSCINYLGWYYCECLDGFIGSGTECLDINECSADNMCHTNAFCLNTQGSYQCLCDSGFTGDGHNCSAVDECSNNTICREDQICINTVQSFQCICASGFSDNGTLCIDINECLTDNLLCHLNALCINQPGFFSCVCKSGFVGDGFHCTDIDECSPMKMTCHHLAHCINTPGSYLCSCEKGFIGNGQICTDINECQLSDQACPSVASCINTIGSYYCVCNQGFTGTGQACTSIDECSPPSSCQANGKCRNIEGKYSCICSSNDTCDPQIANESVLYLHGEPVGDLKVSASGADVNSPFIVPPMGFPFLGSIWDRIYFSDNGLIQFQNFQSNENYLYPNPFKNGFDGNETVPMLAVFWDDADLTFGNGKLLYQVYNDSKKDIYSQLIINRTTEEVNRQFAKTIDNPFVPRWILKVTWDHISPVSFQKKNLSETNTFQCILTTDGIFSFALMKYATMHWNPGQRLFQRVLMGYTNGKGIFYNDPQTQKNETYGSRGRYRPDQVIGNTGLRGQWAYRLDLQNSSRYSKTFRQKCWHWYLTEPHPSTWNTDVQSCPCHESQAKEDNRFIPEIMLFNVSTQQKMEGERTTFQSALPNQFTAGRRCIYSSGYLIEGRTDRYFIFTPEATTLQDHIKGDLEPFEWCCTKSSLCNLYYAKRPIDKCENYTSLGLGQVYGTLHMKTFDGVDYIFHGLGEYVIVRLSSTKGHNIFTLQGQSYLTIRNNTFINIVAFVKFAAFYQGMVRMKVEWGCSKSGKELSVTVNDKDIRLHKGEDLEVYHFSHNQLALVCKKGTRCSAVYFSGLQVTVEIGIGGFLQATVHLPHSFYNRTLGLLGLWSSTSADDLLFPNGDQLKFQAGSFPTEAEIYKFQQSWQVPPPESLFLSHQPMENWRTIRPIFTSVLLASADNKTLNNINRTCSGNAACIHDILVTNDTNIGLQTKDYYMKYEKSAVTFGNMPPTFIGPLLIRVKVNTTTRVQFTAKDLNKDKINFALVPPTPQGATINPATGLLTWTPKTIKPVQLTVQVNDDLSGSFLNPTVQMCNCMDGGECDYDTILQAHFLGKLQIVGCICSELFSGEFCSEYQDHCKGQPCFPELKCINQISPQLFQCGTCPSATIANGKEGYKCFLHDECLPPFPFPCHELANCISTGHSHHCQCKEGFMGDGVNCTDIDECKNMSFCPSAKYECFNIFGAARCACRYHSEDGAATCDEPTNPPGWNVFNCTVKWNTLRKSAVLLNVNSTLFKAEAKKYANKLNKILTQGFENKFYNLSLKSFPGGGPSAEYRVNVSSDTPHWFIQDFLIQVAEYNEADPSVSVEDVNECISGEANCHATALCENTYGGFKCICNRSAEVESQLCYTNNPEYDNKDKLLLGLILGIGLPLLLLLLALPIFYYCIRRKVKAE
ncbi:fibrillin-2 [Chiloscyllium plagiosum]|uniref:fibrillin-2 n=1 Tax=Chiloscyllium plagiosum TaxID=36176 RepID=UPI001CB8345A|nr:fibrillin-2 [Chiloscyllium plagiosum]